MVFSPVMKNEIPLDEIKKNSSRFSKWNFEVPELMFTATGYEDHIDELRRYTSRDFHSADEEGKAAIIKHVADIYEEVGIYPITYFSQRGVEDEIVRCINTEAKFDGDIVSVKSNAGSTLCSWFFPNLFKTASLQDMTPDKAGGESAYLKFYNRKFLDKVVSFCYNYNYPDPNQVGYPGTNPMSGIRMIGSVPTNFRPMNAKAVYERFTPEGGVIFDPSSGFGGRMLGALSSRNNYTYIATDPNTESIYNSYRLGTAIESVTGRTDSFELHCVGSEDFMGPEKSIDFAFTSPPYFDLEQYGADGGDFNSDNQCFNKYPELDDWMEGYVRGTIRNVVHMLKKRKHYAINIADFNLGSKTVRYVDRWAQISAEEGAPLVKTMSLGVRARAGSKLLGDRDGSIKEEVIMVFKKR